MTSDKLQAHSSENILKTIKIPGRSQPRQSGKAIANPHRLARLFLDDHRDDDGALCLILYHESYYCYLDGRWQALANDNLRRKLTARIEREFSLYATDDDFMPGLAPNDGERLDLAVTRSLVGDVIQALDSLLPDLDGKEAPFWIEQRADDPPADNLVPTNGNIVRLDRIGEPMESTPRLFTRSGLDVRYAPDSGEPSSWIKFLDDLWGDDPESVRELQKWFGYLLTNNTRQQKLLNIVGPTRSGKGTIAAVMEAVLGNAESVTFTSLGSRFGLQKLIGRPLAIMWDARNPPANSVLIERLLKITCGEAVEFERKGVGETTLRLPTRLVILSNSILQIEDTAGSLADRFFILRTTRSFKDNPDRDLLTRLKSEASGIFNWALQGLRMLREDGGFIRPGSSRSATDVFAESSDPLTLFIGERCRFGPELKVAKKELYDAYEGFCEDRGLTAKPFNVFGQELIGQKKVGSDTFWVDGGSKKIRKNFYTGIALLADEEGR